MLLLVSYSTLDVEFATILKFKQRSSAGCYMFNSFLFCFFLYKNTVSCTLSVLNFSSQSSSTNQHVLLSGCNSNMFYCNICTFWLRFCNLWKVSFEFCAIYLQSCRVTYLLWKYFCILTIGMNVEITWCSATLISSYKKS